MKRVNPWRLAAACLLILSLTDCSCGSTNKPPPNPGDGGGMDGGHDAGTDAGSGSLHITTTTLPNGTVGVMYSQMLAVEGGMKAPYNWQVSSGMTPPGITLSMGGNLAGVPTMEGKFTFTVTVKDGSTPALTGTASFMLEIKPGTGPGMLKVTTTSLPNGFVGAAYSASLMAMGGTTPYRWTASGALPPGITLGQEGNITGTPTAPGSYSITVQAMDSSSPALTATAGLSITVLMNSGALQVTTTTLPGGTIGVSYTSTLTASGGQTPYTWSHVSGELPAGLNVSSRGVISGTPGSSGTFMFTVQVVDSSTPVQMAQKQLSITVFPPALMITTVSLPNGVVGNAYTATVAGTGGVTPYRFNVTAGALPAGLMLNNATGAISGTPTTAGTSTLTITLSDNEAPTATAQHSYAITISPPTTTLSVTTTALPDGVRGTSYSAMLNASGGNTPYTWTVTAGALPNGLSLTNGGTIQGTATSTGTFSFTAQVADAGTPQQTATQQFTIRIFAPLMVATTTLPNGVTNVAYMATVAAVGGDGTYVFTVGTGSLPPGLSLAANGAISGSPTMAGVFGFNVMVTDTANPSQMAMGSLTITVHAPLQITTTSLPDGTRGAMYGATLVAQGGTPAYTWSVSAGSLPAGVVLDPSSGVLSGTPSVAGMFSFTIQVTDTSSPQQAATQMLSINVIAPASLTITTPGFAGGVTNRAYSASLNAVGGVSPYRWSISAGALPPGLSLNATSGVISGTPTGPGTSMFTVQVTDAASPQNSATRMYSIVITNALQVTTMSLPGGFTGQAYNAALNASGGTTPDTWSITNGSLAPGLSLNPQTGVISGTPSASGSFSFTVQVVDSSQPQQQATGTLTITILPALTITTASLNNGVISTPYSASVRASGGTTPYVFTISQNQLPPGLAMDTAGNITGTPTMAGRFVFTVMVTDASSPTQSASQVFEIDVNGMGVLTITTNGLPNVVQNTPYSVTFNASGGTTPYNWVIASGSIPAGLALNNITGVLSGTPTQPGTFTFTVRVTDNSVPTQVATQQYSFTVFATLTIPPQTPYEAVQGQHYTFPLGASGGDSPYTWAVTGGSLPPGIVLSPSLGLLDGTPTQLGTFTFTVQVTDSFTPPQTASATFMLTVVTPLAFAPINLQTAITNVPYMQTLQATGGTSPYNFSINGGSLPPGLTMDVNGVISGTPTTQGTYAFSVFLQDGTFPPQRISQGFQITVTQPLQVITMSEPRGTLGLMYQGGVNTSGGLGPVTWAITAGMLPPGLTLTADSGVISGTPLETGTYMFTIRATDSSNPPQQASAMLSITISPPGSLSITTATLPDGISGQAYSAQLSAAGGQLPYDWALLSGMLPPGLGLNQFNGIISGTPTAVGSYTFTIQVADNSSPQQTASRSFTIAISSILSITTSQLPSGTVNSFYSATLTGTGGILPYNWTIDSGSLPMGLTLNSSNGTISGVPTMMGTFNFVVRLTDSSQPAQSVTQPLSITINQLLSITTRTLPNGFVGQAYSATLQAMGGTMPYGWSIVSGSFPPGLALNSTTGGISGTPTTPGTFTFTARVTDSGSPQQQASQMLSITIFLGG